MNKLCLDPVIERDSRKFITCIVYDLIELSADSCDLLIEKIIFYIKKTATIADD